MTDLVSWNKEQFPSRFGQWQGLGTQKMTLFCILQNMRALLENGNNTRPWLQKNNPGDFLIRLTQFRKKE